MPAGFITHIPGLATIDVPSVPGELDGEFFHRSARQSVREAAVVNAAYVLPIVTKQMVLAGTIALCPSGPGECGRWRPRLRKQHLYLRAELPLSGPIDGSIAARWWSVCNRSWAKIVTTT